MTRWTTADGRIEIQVSTIGLTDQEDPGDPLTMNIWEALLYECPPRGQTWRPILRATGYGTSAAEASADAYREHAKAKGAQDL